MLLVVHGTNSRVRNDRNRASALAQAQAQNFLQAQQAAERDLARQTQLGSGIAALAGQQGQLGLRQAALGKQGKHCNNETQKCL